MQRDKETYVKMFCLPVLKMSAIPAFFFIDGEIEPDTE